MEQEMASFYQNKAKQEAKIREAKRKFAQDLVLDISF